VAVDELLEDPGGEDALACADLDDAIAELAVRPAPLNLAGICLALTPGSTGSSTTSSSGGIG
jgi:hypothetical protein